MLSSKAAVSEGARRTRRYVERLRDARTPLAAFSRILLVDLAIAGDLGGGGYGRRNLDVRSLDVWESTGALIFRDPRIVRLHELLFTMVIVKPCRLQ